MDIVATDADTRYYLAGAAASDGAYLLSFDFADPVVKQSKEKRTFFVAGLCCCKLLCVLLSELGTRGSEETEAPVFSTRQEAGLASS